MLAFDVTSVVVPLVVVVMLVVVVVLPLTVPLTGLVASDELRL